MPYTLCLPGVVKRELPWSLDTSDSDGEPELIDKWHFTSRKNVNVSDKRVSLRDETSWKSIS